MCASVWTNPVSESQKPWAGFSAISLQEYWVSSQALSLRRKPLLSIEWWNWLIYKQFWRERRWPRSKEVRQSNSSTIFKTNKTTVEVELQAKSTWRHGHACWHSHRCCCNRPPSWPLSTSLREQKALALCNLWRCVAFGGESQYIKINVDALYDCNHAQRPQTVTKCEPALTTWNDTS